MAVLAAAHALGLDMATALGDLGRWQPPAGRGLREVIGLDNVDTAQTLELIDDAYNANPTSREAALEVLAAVTVTHGIGRVARGRRIAYLGDMGELGESEVALHAAIAELPYMARLDTVHCVGPLMRALYDSLPAHRRGDWTETSEEMLGALGSRIGAGDVVLAKGSLSMKLGLLVDAIRKMGHRVDSV